MGKILKNERAGNSFIKAGDDRFYAFLNVTADIVFIMNADWQQMKKMEGRGILTNTTEPLENWILKYIHPLDHEKMNNAIAEAVQNKSTFILEHRILSHDGITGWTCTKAVPVLDEQGEIFEWVGTARDISEMKEAEETLQLAKAQLEQQKRVYETIANSTPDLMYVFDLNYNFTYANDALLTMWGKKWEDAVGRGLLENGYAAWHAEKHQREIDQVKNTGKPIRGEVSFPHVQLGKRVYDYIFTPVFNAAGEVEAVAGTTRDITDIRQNEQRKNDFIAMVSHELKTPFTSLLAYLQLMDKEQLLNPRMTRILERAVKQSQKIESMINGFLTLSRLEDGKMQVDKIPFELSRFLAEVTEEAAILYGGHQLVFQESAPLYLSGDVTKIGLVLHNLLGNAAKYSAPGTEIKLSLKAATDSVTICVQDHGAGIVAHELPMLFDRFYRGQNNKLIAGFGLGLYMCREIIELHGGEIWADSEYGAGSTFCFSLPLEQVGEEPRR